MGSLAKDTTEQDLWAFDDIQPLEDEEVERSSRLSGPAVPPARPGRKPAGDRKTEDGEGSANETAAQKAATESIKVNVGKSRPLGQSGSITGQSKPGADFDDLDHWEDYEVESPAEAPPKLVPMPVDPVVVPEPVSSAPETIPDESSPEDPEESFSQDDSEGLSPPKKAPAGAPVSLIPKMGLSKVERIGLVALAATLLVGGAALYYGAIHRLSSDSQRVERTDFPLKGQFLSIESADSYWRAPFDDGSGQETVRRGTVLIPELILKPQGGPAAIRVFFRNSDGDFVGDAVTRSVHTAAEIRVPATAGFDDIGMHAAYRTGQAKPWTVEVQEAPSENSPVHDFKKLFEMDISTDRR